MPRDANEIYRQRLDKKLNAAIEAAMPHALKGEYGVAEQYVRAIDNDVYGGLALARMYIAAIASLGGENADVKDRHRILDLFERAVSNRERSYPMPHTQHEADSYSEGQAQDRGRVVQEIGFDPSQWTVVSE